MMWRAKMKNSKLLMSVGLALICTSVLAQDAVVEKYDDGKVKAEGTTKDGVKVGLWKFYYKDGTLMAEEQYSEEGLLHGKVRRYDFKGRLSTVETWKDGLEEDTAYEYYPSGKIFRKGNYKEGLQEGEWFTYYENGVVKDKGMYSLGRATGTWLFYDKSGRLLHEATYINGIKEGPARFFDKKGNVESSGNYVNGEMKGEWTKYKNGKPDMIYEY